MENASKALIMAGSILVGVLILSLAAYLFMTFAGYSQRQAEAIIQKQQDQFNQQFLKYDGTETVRKPGTEEYIQRPVLVTAHDIISLANLAQQNNQTQQLEDYVPKNKSQDEYKQYISVQVVGETENLEKWNKEDKNNFVAEGTDILEHEGNHYPRYYECTEVKLSTQTGYVYRIEFAEIELQKYADYGIEQDA